MAKRLRTIGMILAACLIAAPVAIFATIVFVPFWSWIETRFGIESVGHSGPAEWCYLASFILLLICILSIRWALRRRTVE